MAFYEKSEDVPYEEVVRLANELIREEEGMSPEFPSAEEAAKFAKRVIDMADQIEDNAGQC